MSNLATYCTLVPCRTLLCKVCACCRITGSSRSACACPGWFVPSRLRRTFRSAVVNALRPDRALRSCTMGATSTYPETNGVRRAVLPAGGDDGLRQHEYSTRCRQCCADDDTTASPRRVVRQPRGRRRDPG